MTLPVLIVGAGPVGMTLASELTRYGVAVRIVDTAAERSEKSKALVLWSRTLELFDRGMGAARLVDAGFKAHGVAFAVGDKVIGRIAMDAIPSVYDYALMLPQSETERLLEEHLAEQGVQVERGTDATAFQFRKDHVETVLHRSDGRKERLQSQWLVGCDGAHSDVRKALDIPFDGETDPSDWMLADVHMTGYPRDDSDMSIYWHRDGVLIVIAISPGRYRIIVDVPPSGTERPRTLSLEEMQTLVERRGLAGARLSDPVWLSGYRINERKVADYRRGRAFLAGDAAHVHSPAGGQGMNTGMQDAFNLAWKLAIVVRGSCREDLLDSYSAERSYVGDQVLRNASRLTAVGTVRNPVVQMLRNVAAHALFSLPAIGRAVATNMSEVTIGYPDSPLNGPATEASPKPGERVPPIVGQAPIGSGGVPKFALLAEPTAATADLCRRFSALLDPDPRPPLEAGVLSLVRPDGYLLASSTSPHDIAAELENLSGEAPPTAPNDRQKA